MNKTASYTIAGVAIGLFVGSSMGIATGGAAYNGAVFLGPLGGFVGWLISIAGKTVTKPDAEETDGKVISHPEPINYQSSGHPSEGSSSTSPEPTNIYIAGLAILATVWNFHIEVLKMVNLLPIFLNKPWLFAALSVVVSVFFPPFLIVYFFAYLGASHFGASAENGFIAQK